MADKKSELLGLNYSTASSSLRKQIIFHLAGVLGLLACHQCGEEIELERFSIEHKDPWMQADDPKASFFDMSNIAFSHLSCNIGAGSREGCRIHQVLGCQPCRQEAKRRFRRTDKYEDYREHRKHKQQ